MNKMEHVHSSDKTEVVIFTHDKKDHNSAITICLGGRN